PPDFVGDRPTGGTNLWVELLRYFEQDNLYKKWDPDDNRNNIGGMDATAAQVIKLLLCPSDLGKSLSYLTAAGAPTRTNALVVLSSYGGNAGKRSYLPGAAPDFPGLTRDGIFWIDSRVCFADITDGTSTTFLFGERFRYDPERDRRVAVVWPTLPGSSVEGGR